MITIRAGIFVFLFCIPSHLVGMKPRFYKYCQYSIYKYCAAGDFFRIGTLKNNLVTEIELKTVGFLRKIAAARQLSNFPTININANSNFAYNIQKIQPASLFTRRFYHLILSSKIYSSATMWDISREFFIR